MENFIVSARKYRPATFNTVVGQQSITNTLKNAIDNKQLAQAFLFCGPRGVGKTSCARILAKTINCLNITENTEACDQCDSCKGFNENYSFNIHEQDAASNNGVDKIRDLVDQVRFAPQLGKYNIYIIDEVHMLSQAAFNAFLKTLEEPPAHAIFILATTEKHKIIPTILSRCQIFDFKRIQLEDIVKHLAFVAKSENIIAQEDALHIIAQKADGALRDALSIFDQIVSFCGNELSYEAVIQNLNILDYDYFFKVTDALLNNDIPKSLNLFNEILNNGFDGHNFINGLGEHFRNLLVCQDPSTLQLLEVGQNIKDRYQEQSNSCSQTLLLHCLEICNKSDLQYRNSKNQRLLIEVSLMQLCGINGIESAATTEKKTFVVKSTKPKSVQNPLNQPTTPTTKEEIPASQTAISSESTDESGSSKKTVLSLKDRPSRKRTISINLQKVEEAKEAIKKPTDTKAARSNPFGQEQVDNAWSEFAQKTLTQGKHNLYAILSNKQAVLKDKHNLKVTLDNKVQEEVLNEERINILGHLKSTLSNDLIQLELSVAQIALEEMKAYTPEDKFKKMAESNPNLLQMREQFGLELNY